MMVTFIIVWLEVDRGGWFWLFKFIFICIVEKENCNLFIFCICFIIYYMCLKYIKVKVSIFDII